MSIALGYRSVSSATRLAYFFITLAVIFFCLFLLSGCAADPVPYWQTGSARECRFDVAIVHGSVPCDRPLIHKEESSASVAVDPLDAEFDRVIRFAGEVVRSFPDDKPLTPVQIAAQKAWLASEDRRADFEALASWPSYEFQAINWGLYK